MTVWQAIAYTLIASACMNLGLVLQKKGLSRTPASPDDRSSQPDGGQSRRSWAEPVWYVGMALLLGGYGLYIHAVSARSAPISLLQPLSASGLLVVAFLSVVYLKERFGAAEWLGVGLLLAGVVLLGASAETAPTTAIALSTQRYALFLGIIGLVGLAVLLLLRNAGAPARTEFLYGLLTGVLLGAGYLNTKALAVALQDNQSIEGWIALACMIIGLLGGLVMLQLALQRGRALIVTAVNLVTNQVLVVAGGLFCLGERFPHDPLPFLARIAGLGAILGGIVLLARISAAAEQRVQATSAAPSTIP